MTDEQDDQIQTTLESFVPDLLAEQRNERFVRRLLSAEKGAWHDVRQLCTALPWISTFFTSLDLLSAGKLFVVWLDHPEDGDYAYIHFYHSGTFWWTSAVYNVKRRLP